MPRVLRTVLSFCAFALFGSVLLLTGCDSADFDAAPTSASTTEIDARAASSDDPTLRAAMRVQNLHTPALMRKEGIIGTASRLDEAKEGVVVVYVLSPEHAQRANVPAQLDDVKVEVRVTGLITAFDTNNPQTKERPAPNGFSVGHPDITAGTIGARVKDSSGNTYILSNNHVLANVNSANVGDPILQPGPYDGGTAADQIGTLSDFQPISYSANNTIDAAIAAVSSSDLTGATPDYAYGAPSATVVSPSLGLGVQKFGRTTGYTTGSIVATNVTISVCMEQDWLGRCTAAATFVNQFEVQAGANADFSAGGDSGSLIVSNDAGKNPVGLLFAGGGASTFGNPIQAVLDRFNVTIDTGDGGSGGGGGDTNSAPSASFTYDCTDLACSFDGSGSSDSDGTIASYAWTFGNGASGSGASTNHTYGSGGTYTVTLTVTDNDGATDSASQNVTVSAAPSGGDLSLSANGYKQRGRHHIDLTWSGATSNKVDVYRNGSRITTTNNDGAYTDNTGRRGGATYTHRVCEAGTSVCSNTTTTSF